MHPFVISIMPSNTAEILGEKKLNMGDNDVITTKKIVIITPIEITLKLVSITVEDKS